MYNKSNYLQVLKFYCEYFYRKPIKWCLGASGALLVHGVEVEPNDIDIAVDVKFIEVVFNEFNTLDVKVERGIYSYDNKETPKLVVEYGKVPSEIFGFDLSKDKLEILQWNGLLIPVHTLEHELKYYLSRKDKEEKVQLIKERMRELGIGE